MDYIKSEVLDYTFDTHGQKLKHMTLMADLLTSHAEKSPINFRSRGGVYVDELFGNVVRAHTAAKRFAEEIAENEPPYETKFKIADHIVNIEILPWVRSK